jgi:hypothetical protein
MFGLFKKKSEKEILTEQYKALMEEAFNLSKLNRIASDLKYAEANELISKIEKLNEKG